MRAALMPVVRAVQAFHAVPAFRVVPTAVRLVPAERPAVARPETAPRLALGPAPVPRALAKLWELAARLAPARQPVVRADRPCHAAPAFHVARMVVLTVRVVRLALAPCLAVAHPEHLRRQALLPPFAHRIFRVHHPAGHRVPPAADAWSVPLLVPGQPP